MEHHMNDKFTPYPYLTRMQGKEELGTYLVYGSETECKRVQAHSATEAMRLAGFKTPFKITRYDPMNLAILPMSNMM